MAPRTLKETSGRKKSSEFVESAVTYQGGEIGALLAETLSEHLEEGETMPDFRHFFTLIGRRLGTFRSAMVDAAKAHANELGNDDATRAMREDVVANLRRDYIDVREVFFRTFGPEPALALGFESVAAREPAALELQVQRLVDNLSDPDLAMPEPRLPGPELSPPDYVERFRPNLDKLRVAREALDGEHRKADVTLLAKNKAVELYDREFTKLSRCLEAAFVLAGEPELAARVRPSLRRPGRRQEVEDDLPPDETAGATSASPAAVAPPAPPATGGPEPAQGPSSEPADGSATD